MARSWASEIVGTTPAPASRPAPSRRATSWAGEIVAQQRATVPAEEPSFLERAAPFAVRVAAPIVGGAVGLLGGPVGAVAGAVAGGAAGEAAAQKIEGRDLDATDIALAGGLSAIPAGPAGRAAAKLATEAAKTGGRQLLKTAALHAAEGAGQGLLESGVRPIVKEGRAPTVEELGTGVVGGAVIGGSLGTGLDLATRGIRAPRKPVEAVEPAPPPVPDQPTVPPVWQGDAPPMDAPDLGVRRTPVEVQADVMRAEGVPDVWSTLKRPELVDDLGPLPDLGPSPSGGFGRGGRPVDLEPPPEIATQPLEEPGVTMTDIPVVPREADRRGTVRPPSFFDRRAADRRAALVQKYGADNPALDEILTVEREARTDPLTGLWNKRAWEELQASVTPDDHVLMMDMKKFKPINDRFGHKAGDLVLRKMGAIVTEVLGDESSRFGGDEFGGVIRNATPERISALQQEILRRAADNPATLHNPKTGETLDIPGFEVHIAGGANAEVADHAVNAAAAASRAGGRGDVALPGDAPGNRPVEATPGTARAGLGDRDAELAPTSNAIAPRVIEPEVIPPRADNLPARQPTSRPTNLSDVDRADAVAAQKWGDPNWYNRPPSDASRRAEWNSDRAAFSRLIDAQHEWSNNPPVDAAAQPVIEGPRFNRDAALQRMQERAQRMGGDANSLLAAAKEGPGALRDAAEVAASYIEEYAQRNRGKIPSFESLGRAVYRALRNVVPNVQKFLRQIYDQAVSLWEKTGITFGPQPDEPRGVVMGSLGGALQPPGPPAQPPPPKIAKPRMVTRPAPPPVIEAPAAPPAAPPPDQPPIRTEVTGRPVEPAETPRVEHRVEGLRVAEKGAGDAPALLDRETKQRWADLDEPVKKILREYDDERFFNVMKQRNLDAAESMAWDARVRGKAEAAEELRAKIRANPADDVAKRDLVAADLDFIAAQRAMVNDGTGLARALAARARVMEAARQPNDLFLRKVFRELPGVTDRQASDLVAAFRENPDNLQPLLHSAVGHGALQKGLELWKSGLLSAFSTDVANFSGNAIEHHMSLAQTATSAGLDWVLQKIYGGNRARFAGEFGAEWSAGNQALGPAIKNLGNNLLQTVVKGKRKPIDLSRRLEYQTSALSQSGLGQYSSRVFGKLEVADQFFREWGGGAELGKLAYRKAAKGGGSPEEIQKRVARIMQEIADPQNADHADILRAVKQSKETRTFQEQRADSLTETVQGVVRRHPLMQIILPFVRTPGNIAARIIERSPLGAKKALQAFDRFKEARSKFEAGSMSAEEFAEARGQLADAISGPMLGTGLLAGFAGVAQAGGMTGGGPTDAKDRNALRDSGWQPYSFVFTNPATGKKVYVPYNRFEPVSSLLGFAADIIEAKDAKTSGDLFDKALGSVVSNLSSKSYLQGLSDAASLVSNPKQFASEYARSLGGSIVPNIVGRAASAIDPTVRDTRPSSSGITGIPEAVGKTIVSRIPGASTLLPERRSGTGEPIERAGNALTRFVAPAPPSTEKEGGDLQRLLVDVDAVPSAPGRDFAVRGKRVRLTDEEYKLLQDVDLKTTERLRANIRRLKSVSPDKAKNIIESAYQQSRARARARVMASPGFRRRVEAS